jgi:hypothetical protein
MTRQLSTRQLTTNTTHAHGPRLVPTATCTYRNTVLACRLLARLPPDVRPILFLGGVEEMYESVRVTGYKLRWPFLELSPWLAALDIPLRTFPLFSESRLVCTACAPCLTVILRVRVAVMARQLSYIGAISASIAVFNLLPVVGLDGHYTLHVITPPLHPTPDNPPARALCCTHPCSTQSLTRVSCACVSCACLLHACLGLVSYTRVLCLGHGRQCSTWPVQREGSWWEQEGQASGASGLSRQPACYFSRPSPPACHASQHVDILKQGNRARVGRE